MRIVSGFQTSLAPREKRRLAFGTKKPHGNSADTYQSADHPQLQVLQPELLQELQEFMRYANNTMKKLKGFQSLDTFTLPVPDSRAHMNRRQYARLHQLADLGYLHIAPYKTYVIQDEEDEHGTAKRVRCISINATMKGVITAYMQPFTSKTTRPSSHRCRTHRDVR